jgi:nitrogen-specific signal transduction histidine kinase
VNVSTSGPLPPPPFHALRARLLAHADALEAAGAGPVGRELRATVEAWWEEQQQWTGEVSAMLSLHHEINNALVGVRGNAQLLMMGPAVQQPGVKERLEVVIRESGRIRDAASRLSELKSALTGAGPASKAA